MASAVAGEAVARVAASAIQVFGERSVESHPVAPATREAVEERVRGQRRPDAELQAGQGEQQEAEAGQKADLRRRLTHCGNDRWPALVHRRVPRLPARRVLE